MTNIQKVIKIIAIALAIILIVNIFSLLVSLFSSFTNIDFNNEKEITFNEQYDNVERIEIDGVSASITVEEGTNFGVKTINLDKGFTSKLRNKTLKIKENKTWFFSNNDNSQIIITVPSNTTLKELSINTGAGQFIIDSINAKEFELDHGAGLLKIANSTFYKADIDGGAGEIRIQNTTISNLELDSGVGEVDVEADITNNSEISCGVGEVNITLLGNEEDYSIRTEKGIGSIKINNIEQPNNTVYGRGTRKIEVEGGVGSINIDFK